MLQNPQCCFVYYLVFKDQAGNCFRCDRLGNLPEPFQLVNIKFQSFFRRADPVDRSGMSIEHQIGTVALVLFPGGSYSVGKSCPAKSNFITKPFPAVNAFSFGRCVFFFEKRPVRQRGVFITKAFRGVNAFIISICQCGGSVKDSGWLRARGLLKVKRKELPG